MIIILLDRFSSDFAPLAPATLSLLAEGRTECHVEAMAALVQAFRDHPECWAATFVPFVHQCSLFVLLDIHSRHSLARSLLQLLLQPLFYNTALFLLTPPLLAAMMRIAHACISVEDSELHRALAQILEVFFGAHSEEDSVWEQGAVCARVWALHDGHLLLRRGIVMAASCRHEVVQEHLAESLAVLLKQPSLALQPSCIASLALPNILPIHFSAIAAYLLRLGCHPEGGLLLLRYLRTLAAVCQGRADPARLL